MNLSKIDKALFEEGNCFPFFPHRFPHYFLPYILGKKGFNLQKVSFYWMMLLFL